MSAGGAEFEPVDIVAPVFRRSALEMLKRLGGDKLVSDVIDVFTANAPRLIFAARAGAEANNGDAVARSLHSLKSSAGQLGAARMQQLCAKGEMLASHGAIAQLLPLVLDLDAAYEGARVHLDTVRRTGLDALPIQHVAHLL